MLVLVWFLPQPAEAEAFRLDIPAASAEVSLQELAHQTGYSVLYQSDEVETVMTRPVSGRMSVERALATMLAQTPLSFGLNEGTMITITRARSTRSSPGEEEMPHSVDRSASVLKRMATALVLSFSPQVMAQDTDSEETVLEEVVVTATRRGAENSMDVPLSISAFGGNFVEDQGFDGVYDFLQLAPGVSSRTFAPGKNRIQMRGVSVGVGENNVGFYVDEVPLSFINQADLPDVRSFDIERVEVLRGPQGTLYGAGALAGVVRTITRDPDLESFGFVGDFSMADITDGGETYEGNVMFNAPIIKDRFAARVVYSQEDQDGWIDQTVMGREDYNATDFKNFRLKLLGRVNDSLDVSVMYWNSQIDTLSSPASYGDRTNTEVAETPSNYDYDIYNLTLNYSGEDFGLVSATSYSELDSHTEADFILGYTLETLLDPVTFTQEVRAFSTYDGMWQWTAGAFYRDAEQTQIQQSYALTLLGLDPVNQDDTVESTSVFAELTYTVLDGRLDLTAGARYISEDRSTVNNLNDNEPFSSDANEVVPRLNATYRANDDWMTFVNYSEGYRSGINQFAVSLETANAYGVDIPLGSRPEFSDSYEWGVKGTMLDDRVTLDLVAFYLKWKDLQTSVPVISGVLAGVVNAAEAESSGLEAAIGWMVTDYLNMSLTGSWNDAHYSSDVYADAVLIDPDTGLPSGETLHSQVIAAGDRLNNVPEWTAGATMGYARPLSGNLEFVANASAQFAGARETRASGQVAEGDDLFTADARVGLNIGQWGFYLYAQNLTDEDGIVTPVTRKVDYGYRYKPRTVGVNVRFVY